MGGKGSAQVTSVCGGSLIRHIKGIRYYGCSITDVQGFCRRQHNSKYPSLHENFTFRGSSASHFGTDTTLREKRIKVMRKVLYDFMGPELLEEYEHAKGTEHKAFLCAEADALVNYLTSSCANLYHADDADETLKPSNQRSCFYRMNDTTCYDFIERNTAKQTIIDSVDNFYLGEVHYRKRPHKLVPTCKKCLHLVEIYSGSRKGLPVDGNLYIINRNIRDYIVRTQLREDISACTSF